MMRTQTPQARRRRPGFTLIEMLVVISLLLVLATLTVAIAPRFQERQRVAKAADLLQGGLLIAKQRAKNDRVPTGVRIYLTGNPPRATELQYIQQPDDFRVGRISVPSAGYVAVITQGDLTGGAPAGPAAAPQLFWPVQVGDYLEIKGGGLLHRITGVGAQQLQVYQVSPQQPPFPYPIAETQDYRIFRAPRLLQGETPLQLAQDVAIDFGPNPTQLVAKYGPTHSVGFGAVTTARRHVDILFAPAGGVLQPIPSGDKIMLWLRDITQDPTSPGEQILVTVHVRTGLIAASPVDTGSPDPYSFANDPRSSGL